MPTDAINPIQEALYTKLISITSLMNKVNGIYDFVPQGTEYPYVTIGENTQSDWGSKTFTGFDDTISIHTWSRGAGRKSCAEIMSDIYSAIHEGSLSVSGFKVTVLRQEFSEIILDPDGQTYHGIQRFRITLREE